MNNFICWCLASNDACITKKSHLHIHETLSKKTIVVWTTHIGIFFSSFFVKPSNTFIFHHMIIKISYSVQLKSTCKYDRKNCLSSTLWWSYSYFFKSWVMTAIKNIIPTTNYAFIKDGSANKIRVSIVRNA